MERRKSKVIIISLVILLLVALLQVNSNAAETGEFNFIAINNTNSEPISELSVAIYQVGTQTEEGSFALSEGFESCTLELTQENIEKLKAYAKENAEPAYIKTTDAEGKFSLTEINTGVYLFVQNSKTEDYTMQTMLVTNPDPAENKLNYDVIVKPKISAVVKDAPASGMVTDTTLPYTGVLNWPVPVLVIIGIIIFCIGWLKFYTDSKKKVN